MSDSRLMLAALGLHPYRVRALVESHGSAAAVFALICDGQIKVTDRARAVASRGIDHVREMIEACGAQILLRGSDDFPHHLADRQDAPDVLFVKGELPADLGVAVVGTRACTGYGKRVATAYGNAIAVAGWTLVSGLARGIDGAAHAGTVAAGGVGVAVLGSGIDVWYPKEHRRLGEDLVAGGGAIVSEYPPGTPPEPWRFPPRNRIISGLSAAVVVVEAKVTGGALITAMAALDQGVPVYALPGDIDRASSEGCNRLIRDGAHPVLDPDDLIAELELVMGPTRARPTTDADGIPIPSTGVSAEAFVESLDLPINEALAHLARLETIGRIRRVDGLVLPG
ncbi:MAG: DNA-protecting protein DprA [Acidimicrobiia bacterium]|nr:DNA-processing protein DprA [Acidimicrobiia bacterium]NNF62700.1 DNA-protecting protein DprA [Acidimicrobiia bacterium]